MKKGQTGKAEWIQSALDEHEGALLRYATRLLGDVERAREVVQDTFLRLCREDRAVIGSYLTRWLFTVCRNRSLDVRKKESRMRPLEETQLSSSPDNLPTPARVLEQKENVSRILAALERLPASQQEVVRLRFQNEFSYKEISDITGLSVTNVGFLLHTAIQSLRRKLNEEAAVPETIRRIK